MTDGLAEVLKGISPGMKLRGQVYMKVDLGVRNPGGRTSLGGLAQTLVVQPQWLLRTILSQNKKLRAINRQAADALCLEQATLPGMRDERPRRYTFGQMRSNLLDQASVRLNFTNSGRVDPRYHGWSIIPGVTIAVPLSSGMVDVIKKSRRWSAIKVDVEAFEKKLDAFADRVIGLSNALAELCREGQRGLPEVGMLVALSQYCDLLLDQQGNPEPGEDPLADFQAFLQGSAIPLFIDKIVRNPEDLAPDAARRRDTHALHLMRALDDPEFDAGAKVVVDNHDIVPRDLLDRITYFFTAAADLMALTDRSDEFAEKHALPMVGALASVEAKDYDRLIDRFRGDELIEAMRTGWEKVLVNRKTIYSTVIGISSGVVGSVSNLEGPRSIVVAVMMQYQAHLFQRGINNFASNAALFDRATHNFFKHFADVDLRKLAAARKMVADATFAGKKLKMGEIQKALKLDVTRGPLRGVTARRSMFALTLMVATVTAAANLDSEDTAYLAMGSAFGSLGVATLDLPKVAAGLERRWKQHVPKIAGRLAGAVTVMGVVSGAMVMHESFQSGDEWGILEGALGLSGSFASLAGWCWTLKLGSTLAVAPSILMTAGSVLVVVGIGVGLWRTFVVRVPQDVVNATLDHLGEDTSRASTAGLGPTIEVLHELSSRTSFVALGPQYDDALRGLGYDDGTVRILRGIA